VKVPAANLRSLDMLRGVLAVYVLLGHCRWLLWTGHSSWMAQPHARWLEPVVHASASVRYGREAVMVFFVLSGFFIHLRMAERANLEGAGLSTRGFYWRRAHRLGAPYALALVVTLVCDVIGRTWFPTLYHAATGDPLTDGVFRRAGYGWDSVIPALVVLPSSRGYDFGTNGPLWSLAFEVVYYALYPAWIVLRRKSAALAFLVVPALCLALALLPGQPFLVTVLISYPVWLAGAALAEGLARRRSVSIPVAASCAAFIAGFGLHLVGRSAFSSAIAAMIFGVGAVAAFAGLSDRAVRSPLGALFEYLGQRSYSIYIVHFPFLALISAAVFQLYGARPSSGWLAVGGASAAVAFGCLCFEVCERHFVHHKVPAGGLNA
jgi:peptidoglycan/LPS O-acetylase OafA/YrhL